LNANPLLGVLFHWLGGLSSASFYVPYKRIRRWSFFCSMGESQMGRYGFSSWTLHMASITLFSTLWGFALEEWLGASRRTRTLVWLGIACGSAPPW